MSDMLFLLRVRVSPRVTGLNTAAIHRNAWLGDDCTEVASEDLKILKTIMSGQPAPNLPGKILYALAHRVRYSRKIDPTCCIYSSARRYLLLIPIVDGWELDMKCPLVVKD